MAVTFNHICELLEKVEEDITRRPRLPAQCERNVVERSIRRWFAKHRTAIDGPTTDGGALLSVLLPHRRKDLVFNLQEKSLSKKIVSLANLNHKQEEAVGQWKDGAHGDLGACVQEAFRRWDGTFNQATPVSLERIDRCLVQLAARCRFSAPAIRRQRDLEFDVDKELRSIFVRLHSREAKWFVRLLLRKYCTINMDEDLVLEQYHFLLPDLLVFQNDFNVAFQLLHGDLQSYPHVAVPNEETRMRIEATKLLKAVVGTKVGPPTFQKAWSIKHCLQMTEGHVWAAEVKYDGEYCEIHINLEDPSNVIQIFSKNGKDATEDRVKIHDHIRAALRIGQPGGLIQKKCIVLGELVCYSDKERTILPFSKIRKHFKRSDSFLGTEQDSLPHEWEHLMIVFFDVLVLDDRPVFREDLQQRRILLRKLVQMIPGRAMRAEWTNVDCRSERGVTDLKQTFARCLANRQEGLVLKPMHMPYFSMHTGKGPRFFIKMKMDYLADMGGQRDLGDFAVIGASKDAQLAAKPGAQALHWTHFHLGCLTNKAAVERFDATPMFKVVGTVSIDQCIPKPDLKHLNDYGRLREEPLALNGLASKFKVIQSRGYGPKTTVAFKKPFIVEILGGGYQKVQNETFEMLRHPRVKKIHEDRDWLDAVTMQDLERMAKEKWEVPDPQDLEGHAKDVARLVKKYSWEIYGSQVETQTTPRETAREPTSGQMPSREPQRSPTPEDAVVQETQESTWSTTSTTQYSSSTQGNGTRASKHARSILVREDTSEKVHRVQRVEQLQAVAALSTPVSPPAKRKRLLQDNVNPPATPPPGKRRRIRTPLKDAKNRHLGSIECDSREKTIHIYAEPGWEVKVHKST
ncbi:hypothetical protein M011DRAFT_404973 [Sporormia fimetaria CBS 119925]|uniref:ATP-dependent DNA ligase family profile domain-containing protein n=1 Tax=Sporormia fimetaria CBS 119925 TaxID=1340428 RepID=A0A6A6V6C5_9PLEO|nr:hypothetical protein M011DRAFT_404973 [Sporormia fimetaria CBS 119925]